MITHPLPYVGDNLQARQTEAAGFLEMKNPGTACSYSSGIAPAKSRSDGIRTHDLCVPNAALYQAEPRFDIRNFL